MLQNSNMTGGKKQVYSSSLSCASPCALTPPQSVRTNKSTWTCWQGSIIKESNWQLRLALHLKKKNFKLIFLIIPGHFPFFLQIKLMHELSNSFHIFPTFFFQNEVHTHFCGQQHRAKHSEWLTGVRGKALVLMVRQTAVEPEVATLNDRFFHLLQIQWQP